MAFSTSFLSTVAASGGLATAARGGPPAATGDPATGAAIPGPAGFGSLLQQVASAGEGALATALPPGIVRQLALALDGGKLATDGTTLPGQGSQLPLDPLAMPTAASMGVLAGATGLDGQGDATPLTGDEEIDPLAGFDWLASMGLPADKALPPVSADATAVALPTGQGESAELTLTEASVAATPVATTSMGAIGHAAAAAASVVAPDGDGQAIAAAGTGSDAQRQGWQNLAQSFQPATGALAAGASDAVNATANSVPLGGQPTQSKGGEGDFARLVQAIESEAAGAVAETGTSESGVNGLREPAARSPQTGAAAAATAQVQVPVGRPGWSEAVLEKVMWFSSQFIDSAEIQLSPPELGPVQVRISTQHEQASVYFASHNAAVRDALDQALPRLRELFENQGLQLADAGVGERSFAEQRAAQQGERDGRGDQRGLGAGDPADEPGSEAPAVLAGVGLVDAYA